MVHPLRLVAPAALAALALTACGGESPAAAPTSTVTVTSAAATTAGTTAAPTQDAPTSEATTQGGSTGEGSPTPTGSGSVSGFGSDAPAPTGSASAPESPTSTGEPSTTRAAGRHTVQGEAGGTLTVDGTAVGRSHGGTSALWERLGTPTRPVSTCHGMGATLEKHVYGGLTVYVPTTPVPGEYGSTWPVGSVGGWSIDGPASDGITATGPKGTRLGTSLATLQQRFTKAEWEDASVSDSAAVDGTGPASGRMFTIFAGDTTGAAFHLGAGDRVTGMTAGLACER